MPETPPPPGGDRLLWQIAQQLRAEHRNDGDGYCLARLCRQVMAPWPCQPSHLATAGILRALRFPNSRVYRPLFRGHYPVPATHPDSTS